MALAGYAATPAVWTAFEAEWRNALADDSARPSCRCLHMKDANALRGEFSAANGWTRRHVQRLLADLFNRCFSPVGPYREVPDALVGASCWVDLEAYRRVCEIHPHFAEKRPEALCVDHVVTIALGQLCPGVERMALRDLIERRQSIDLFFDRGEPFRRQIQRVWDSRPWHRLAMPLRLVNSIRAVDRTSSAAIQAADYLAWHTNRDAVAGGDLKARASMWLATHCYPMAYDYDKLLETAALWRLGRGYGS
jgi:hypothetical protein